MTRSRGKGRGNWDTRVWDERWMPEPNTGCHLWLGGWSKNPNGYGTYGVGSGHGRHGKAHREAWRRVNGEIPEGMQVCHRCDTPACVNPEHLFLGTSQDNTDDKMRKGRHDAGIGNTRLRDCEVEEIRRLYGTGRVSQRMFRTTQANVWAIVNDKTWRGGDGAST